MEVLWYCPKCGKQEIKNFLPEKNRAKINKTDTNELTFTNLRDGYGTPIRHYLCECGNDKAGAMHFDAIKDGMTNENIWHFKSVIDLYQ